MNFYLTNALFYAGAQTCAQNETLGFIGQVNYNLIFYNYSYKLSLVKSVGGSFPGVSAPNLNDCWQSLYSVQELYDHLGFSETVGFFLLILLPLGWETWDLFHGAQVLK